MSAYKIDQGRAPLTNTISLTITSPPLSAKCWGRNDNGQIGDGTLIDRLTATTVSGFSSDAATVISAGREFNCAVTSGGAAKCWGQNTSGQLGDGTTTQRTTPINVSGMSSGVTSISAGELHTCAVQNGAAKCWGQNGGKLGDGTTTNRSVPTGVVELSSGVSTISAAAAGGGTFSCAILTAGTAMCWGSDSDGQLGDGTTTDSLVPVSVLTLTGATVVTAGNSHACALADS